MAAFHLFVAYAELEQLKKGFHETLQMELLVALHPREMRSFLAASSNHDITPDSLLGSFVVCYSDQGSKQAHYRRGDHGQLE